MSEPPNVPEQRGTRWELTEHNVRVVRSGHGANCSSIGSVIDTLFATATVGAAVFVGVLAALRKEGVRVVGGAGADSTPDAATKTDRASNALEDE